MTGPLLLFITTFIWGTAFLAQKIGGESLGPFSVTCLRSILGGTFLLVFIFLRNLRLRRTDAKASIATTSSVKGGVICGVPLFAAMLTQQIGIADTTPGISAFLTTNYVIFVPIVAALLSRRLPRPTSLVCALGALAGTYFICIRSSSEGLTGIGRGEAWTLLCALLFALQMIAVDRFAKKTDLLVMSAAQLFTCALLSAPFLFIPGERIAIQTCSFRTGDVLALLYLGVFSSGIAYTLQNFGQARTNAALAAVICSMESVFGLLSGCLVLGDTLTVRQMTGCALVFVSALTAAFLSAEKH